VLPKTCCDNLIDAAGKITASSWTNRMTQQTNDTANVAISPGGAVSIDWPCLYQAQQSAELAFIADPADLQHAVASCWQPGDQLIDSGGKRYIQDNNDWVSDGTLDHTMVLQLVRQHASACGQCCVSKLYLPTIRQLVQMVDDL